MKTTWYRTIFSIKFLFWIIDKDRHFGAKSIKLIPDSVVETPTSPVLQRLQTGVGRWGSNMNPRPFKTETDGKGRDPHNLHKVFFCFMIFFSDFFCCWHVASGFRAPSVSNCTTNRFFCAMSLLPSLCVRVCACVRVCVCVCLFFFRCSLSLGYHLQVLSKCPVLIVFRTELLEVIRIYYICSAGRMIYAA